MSYVRIATIGLIAMTLVAARAVAAAPEPQTIPLWPAREGFGPELEKQEKLEDHAANAGKPDRFIADTRWPTLTVYLPPKEQATGAAVIMCPGGGYHGVAMDKEGHDVARWLNSIGVAGVVLKYRMPQPASTPEGQKPLPLQDAQRAIRMVRSHATEWQIDPNRVGVMGFSAGGHLASTAGTHFDAPDPAAADPLDRLSDRPDFLVLVYPVVTLKEPVGHGGSRANLLGKTPDPKLVEEYSNDEHVTAQTPPTFLVHAKDDKVNPQNSVLFHDALQKAGVPTQLELYEKGGHGFGMGVNGGEVATWPGRLAEWMKARKLLEKK